MTNMTDPSVYDAPQLMLVPGGTTPGAVTMTYSAVHKLWELYERYETTGVRRKSWTIVVPREMAECLPNRAAQSNAKLQARIKQLPVNVDVVLETSGSTTGQPRLVGLSYAALVASARATHEVLGGPGRWIVALPVHHVAGLHTLVRSCVAETSPIIADMSTGFDAQSLLRACQTAVDDKDNRSYLSLVPKQLADALDHGGELVELLAQLDAILVGGSGTSPALLDRARAAGLRIVTTYGMTETCGGCVYDGKPLPGVDIRVQGGKIQIAGPVLMETYLDEKPSTAFVEDGGKKWLKTSDAGVIEEGVLSVLGRSDDVIISGGVNVAPARVADAITEMPGVEAASVVALPDDTWGQVVAAAVVGPTEPLDEFAQRVRDHVGDRLGRDHAPRVVAVVDELPVTDLGKVDRFGVASMLRDLVDGGRAWVR
ncbi:MAG: AMP-binding protein [Actinomycetaceae bacterium]|nr:AMP-binding protein [Actinomycetaceae bacterium]